MAGLVFFEFFLHRCQRIIGLKYQLMLAELVFPKWEILSPFVNGISFSLLFPLTGKAVLIWL